MDLTTIEYGSEAFEMLTSMIESANILSRDIHIHTDTFGVKLKVGAGMWTPSLEKRVDSDNPHPYY